MPKAEFGSTKFVANKLKAAGLQRLRWYCQICQRQMRDENGFKQHTQSESHVRQMLVVGEDSKKYLSDFSRQFKHDFLQLLRTSHSTKSVNANHFYQEYIKDKNHVHQHSTTWHSLTDFVKHLGREGICRVEEGEKGLEVAWIDNSPEALKRQDALRRKERQDKGDEERELALIAEQVERARMDAENKEGSHDSEKEEAKELRREEGQKVKLNFGVKKEDVASTPAPAPKNALAKNVFGGRKSQPKLDQPKKPVSEAERIMREETERKRKRDSNGGLAVDGKRARI